MSKNIVPILLLFLFISCSNDSKKEAKKLEKEAKTIVKRDLSDILKDGKLRVSTIYSGTSYFLYKGKPMGFEFELLERFAEYLDVDIEIVVANDINNLISNLNNGKVDLMAHGLTITTERKEAVSFSDYIYLTKQVLVQKKPDNWRKMKLHEIDNKLIRDAIELDNKTVSVRKETAYNMRLENLSDEIGGTIKVDYLDGSLTTDEIIGMVANGQIKYTVADDNIANLLASANPILDVRVPVSFSQRVGWATRIESPKLLDELNKWLREFKKEVDYYVIYDKYFESKRDFRRRIKSDFYSHTSNRISEYDDVIKEYSIQLDWDWRLLCSLIYQESRFEPGVASWAGAAGLMQMMPATAKEMGVKNRRDPHDNLRGGTKYLKWIWDNFDNIQDSIQRTKFTMASYNCGYGHVLDAQRLAKEEDLDSLVWDGHVEKMILALSSPKNYNKPMIQHGYVRGIEPYTYVRQIFERYVHYQELIKA